MHENLHSPFNSEIPVDTTSSPPTIYVGNRAFSGSIGKVQKSVDGGESWETILGDSLYLDILDMKMDPTDPGVFYVLCERFWFDEVLLYRFTHGHKELLLHTGDWYAMHGQVWISSEHPEWLYLELDDEVSENMFVSRDGGSTWRAWWATWD